MYSSQEATAMRARMAITILFLAFFLFATVSTDRACAWRTADRHYHYYGTQSLCGHELTQIYALPYPHWWRICDRSAFEPSGPDGTVFFPYRPHGGSYAPRCSPCVEGLRRNEIEKFRD